MSGISVNWLGLWSRIRAGSVLSSIALLGAACGGVDGDAIPSAEDDGGADDAEDGDTGDGGDDNGDGGDGGDNGNGGLEWPPLPTGPDIPGVQEIDAYVVLAAADAARCADLFSPSGVVIQIREGSAVAGFVAADAAGFQMGDRARHLYAAAAHLCANDEAEARAAFADALNLGSWPDPVEDEETQLVVCRVWDAVTGLLDPGAGPCTLQVAAVDDGDTGGTDDGDPTDTGADDGEPDDTGADDDTDPGEDGDTGGEDSDDGADASP